MLIVAGLLGAGWYFVGHGWHHGEGEQTKVATSASAAAAPPVVVTVAEVVPRAMQRTVPIVGTFLGIDEIAISPKVDGRIVKIVKDLGDLVRPGELLLQIEEIDYRLAVAEAQRGLDLELSRLGLKSSPEASFDVKTLPAVVKAEAQARNARSKRDRMRSIGQAGTPEQWEQAETDYEIARANYEQAIMEAEATLASVRLRQAMLATAHQRLEECRVAVPQPSPERLAELRDALGEAADDLCYVVAQRMVSEGEMVRTLNASPVYRLVLDRPLKLQGAVPERFAAEVKVGQKVAIQVEAYPQETFEGQVARVNPTVDRVSRTFQVEVLVPNLDRRLRAGSFAKAAIATRTEQGALTVPEQALDSFAGVVKVFVIENEVARAVPVRVGTRLEITSAGTRESWLEVEGELHAGQPVITSGQSQLANGSRVRIRSSETPE